MTGGVGQIKLAEYFDVDDLGMRDQQAAQDTAGVICWSRPARAGVIHRRHAAFDRPGAGGGTAHPDTFPKVTRSYHKSPE